MRVGFSGQYNTHVIVVGEGDDVEDVIAKAEDEMAVVDDRDGHHFVVQFPGRTPELYTEGALRGSFPIPAGA